MTTLAPVTLAGVEAKLENERKLFDGAQQQHYAGSDLVPNRDPIIRYLAPYQDERAYVAMEEGEPKLYEAWQHRRSAVLGHTIELMVGESRSPAAVVLHEFGLELVRRIPRWKDVLSLMLDARKWGWRPMQLILDTEATFKGRPAWMIKKVVDQPAHAFRFTRGGDLALIQGPNGRPEVFSGIDGDLGWLPCVSGSIGHPYGTAIYRSIWLLWYLKTRFLQSLSQGMDRSMGLLKAKRGTATTGIPIDGRDRARPSLEETANELRAVLEYLSQNNVLIETDGWTIDMITDISFAQGWMDPLEYIDDGIQRAVSGQTLTSDARDRGTQALGTVHERVRDDIALDDGEFLEECCDTMLEKYVRANFGEVDPRDLPHFYSHTRSRIDLKKAEALVNMGAIVDGIEVARQAGVPLLLAEGQEEMPLKKQQPPKMIAAPVAQAEGDDDEAEDEQDKDDETPPPPDPKDKRKVAREAEQRSARRVEQDLEDLPDSALAALNAHSRRNLERFLNQEFGDPLPKATARRKAG